MKIQKEIASRSLVQAAIEQTAIDYANKGYSVETEVELDNRVRADIVARKNNKVIVFEIKSGPWNNTKTEQVSKLRDYVVNNLGAEFKLVLINSPEEKSIYVDGIEDILRDILHDYTYEVAELATHVHFENINSVELTFIEVGQERIKVHGYGIVSYELEQGSNSDISSESFPFTFELELDRKLEPKEPYKINIDTSSFFE